MDKSVIKNIVDRIYNTHEYISNQLRSELKSIIVELYSKDDETINSYIEENEHWLKVYKQAILDNHSSEYHKDVFQALINDHQRRIQQLNSMK